MTIGIAGQKIIRQGLGIGHKACQGLITTRFSLYCVEVIIPPEHPPGGGGGPYPEGMGAWNQFDRAEDIFQPVDQDIYDPNKIYKTKKEIIIRVELKDFHMEKTFLVPYNRAKVVVKIINLLNTTRTRITASVTNIKRILHNITISITNLTRKK